MARLREVENDNDCKLYINVDHIVSIYPQLDVEGSGYQVDKFCTVTMTNGESHTLKGSSVELYKKLNTFSYYKAYPIS